MKNSLLLVIGRRSLWRVACTILVLLAAARSFAAQDDPLPSWNEGAAKSAILEFVNRTTTQGSADFVAPGERVATFDQDGTLWVEQPLYSQALFAVDRLIALAPQHPEWTKTEPFKSVLAGDRAAMSKFSEKDWIEIVAVTHAGMSNADFEAIVANWLPRSKNPIFGGPVTELTYQPMREVMELLRANGFQTWIVTGGGQEFVRVYGQQVYGVPTEQVIGSSIVTRYEMKDGKPVLMRDAALFFNDDKDGKAIGIDRFIGKRPQIAFGNTAGDKEMLQWTTAGDGLRLGFLLLHDDMQREVAYGPANGLPATAVGTFSQALMDTAKASGWTVISMKNDWNRVFTGDIKKLR